MNSVWLKSTMVIHTVLWGLNLTIEWAAYINQEMSSTAEDMSSDCSTADLRHAAALQHNSRENE